MRSRPATLCILLLLVVTIGGQWALLQSVAWVGMMIEYSRDGSITVAVCKTFDGKHPCCLCKAIAAGKRSEQKKDVSFQLQKLEFPLFHPLAILQSPPAVPVFPSSAHLGNLFFSEPPTPPPRPATV